MTDGNPRNVTGTVVALIVVSVIALGAAGVSVVLYSRNTSLTTRVGTIEKHLVDAGIMKAKGKKGAPAAAATGGKAAARRKAAGATTPTTHRATTKPTADPAATPAPTPG